MRRARARHVLPAPLTMRTLSTLSTLSLLRLPALVAALSLLLPFAARAQTTEGSASNGSTTEGSTSNGSTTEGSSSNGSTTEGSASGGGGTGTTSYDSPNVYNLGGSTVSLATAILNGGTVTNGTLNASTEITGYSGSITASLDGTAALTKSTSGTLILAGANAYSGGTTISGGTLQIGDGGSVGNLFGNATNNATLLFNRADDYAYTGVISGSGDVTTAGGVLRFSQAQTYTGNTTVLTGFLALATTVDQGLSASTKVDVASGAFFDFSNRALTVAGLTGGGTVYSFGGSSGHLTVNTADGERQTFSGALGGSYPNFGLTKSGAGTLVLSGSNTYTGSTDVTGGTLLVNGSLGATMTNVALGATLGGAGSIGGATTVESGGILAPGDSVGTLTFTNGLTLNAGAVLNFDLGTTSDLIAVTGGVLTGPGAGTVTVNLADAGGFGAATYTLFSFSGAQLSGFDLTDFTLGTTPGGWNYAFDLTADSLQLTVTASAVPEPATYAAMIGALALGLALVRRRLRS